MKSRRAYCLTLTLAAVFSTPAQTKLPTADDVVAKILAARGGLVKIKAVQSQRITGTISFAPDAEGPFFVEFKRPGKMHMEFTIENMTMVRIYDGKSGAWVSNPFIGKTGFEPMSGEEMKSIDEESDFDGPLVDSKAKGNQIEFVGKEQIDGRDAYRLKLTTKSGNVRHYLYDATSFLLLKWEGKRSTQGEERPVESFFHDHRDVQGLKFAFEIVSISPGSGSQQRIVVEKIELNPNLDEARFSQPASAPLFEESEPGSTPADAPPPNPPPATEQPK